MQEGRQIMKKNRALARLYEADITDEMMEDIFFVMTDKIMKAFQSSSVSSDVELDIPDIGAWDDRTGTPVIDGAICISNSDMENVPEVVAWKFEVIMYHDGNFAAGGGHEGSVEISGMGSGRRTEISDSGLASYADSIKLYADRVDALEKTVDRFRQIMGL